MSNVRMIDIANVAKGGIHNLSGKLRGESAREYFGLDRLDEDDQQVTVVFPEELYAISSSFFLGMFSLSIRKFGEEKFLKKYKFQADENMQRQIRHGVKRATMSRESIIND